MDKSKCYRIATDLILKHGLQGWRFKQSRSARALGSCKYKGKFICVSKYYIEKMSEEEFIETVLHEIAHAIAGHSAGHGPIWKAAAIKIGAKPETCYSGPPIEVNKTPVATGICRCTIHKYYRMPKNVARKCLLCRSTFICKPYTGNVQHIKPKPRTMFD